MGIWASQGLKFDANGNLIATVVPPTGSVAYVAAATGVASTDTASINSAIAAAGVNGIIHFPPNQTYVSWGAHVLLSGQKVIGHGSKIQRPAQVSSVYAGAAVTTTSNTTSIQVATGQGANFAIGMQVALTNGDGTGDGHTTGYYAGTPTINYTTRTSIITAIVGDVLTVSPAMNAKLASGGGTPALDNTGSTYVVTCGPMVVCGYVSWASGTQLTWANLPVDQVITGLWFDGAYTTNTKGRWWDVSPTLYIGSHYVRVYDNKFTNLMSDGIVVSGKGPLIDRNYFSTVCGNCIHPGSWDGTNGIDGGGAHDNWAYDFNKDLTIGHANAAYCTSNNVTHWEYVNNHADTGGARGFGPLGSLCSDVLVAENYATNCVDGGFQLSGAARVRITGNDFKNNGTETTSVWAQGCTVDGGSDITISGNGFSNDCLILRASTQPSIVSGNTFHDTRNRSATWNVGCIYINAANHWTITGNSFYGKATPDANTMYGIYLSSASYNDITNNDIEHMEYGLYLNGVCSYNNVTGNYLADCYDIGMFVNATGAIQNNSITNNEVLVSAGAAAGAGSSNIRINTFAGSENTLVAHNTIRNYQAAGTQYGILIGGANNLCNIIGNDVRVTSAGAASIYLGGTGDTTLRLLGNMISKAYTFGTAVGTTVLTWNGAGDSNLVG